MHGRTVEFGTKIDINIAAIPRGTEFKGRAPGGEGLKYTSKYAAVGAVTFKDMALADGLNGLQAAPRSGRPRRVAPR